MEAVMRIEPASAFLRCGTAWWMVRYVPRRFTAMVASHSSGCSSSMGAQTPLMPALANTMSRRPKARTVSSTALCISSELATSATSGSALPPARSMSAAASRISDSVWLRTPTRAPSRAKRTAVARPMPDPAPVTSATLPSNSIAAAPCCETAGGTDGRPVRFRPSTRSRARRRRTRSMAQAAFRWWQTGVVYQIYPRSFQDSNGDGIGDLRGIAARLDHLVSLGVDAVWISPIYPSPMADFGYDVSDHCAVHPDFGTLADFDALLAAAHGRGLKVILDYVPNHTSDRHPWFLESRSSRTNQKRDWYIWRDGKRDGSPPTNWLSEFGGPGWTWDEATGQYYYHAYLKEQPDLNWRNLDARQAMLEVLRFWFERGVDGFRVDAIHLLFEDEQLRDNPINKHCREGMSPSRRLIRAHTMDQPEVHEAIAAMRRVADTFEDRVMIGEAYLPIDRLMAYYGLDLTGFHLPFNFHLLSTPWHPIAVAALIEAYEAALPPGAWPNWVLGNHDHSRLASRLGLRQARVAAMLLLTLRGTPTIYQSEEIGMTDVPIPPERVQDPWERNVPGLGRDPER